MAESCTLSIKAIPNAPRNEIVGWLGDALKVKIHAPAIEGRASAELCAFLAATLGVPTRAVSILRGETSRLKVLKIDGVDRMALRHKLDSGLAARASG